MRNSLTPRWHRTTSVLTVPASFGEVARELTVAAAAMPGAARRAAEEPQRRSTPGFTRRHWEALLTAATLAGGRLGGGTPFSLVPCVIATDRVSNVWRSVIISSSAAKHRVALAPISTQLAPADAIWFPSPPVARQGRVLVPATGETTIRLAGRGLPS